MRRSLLSLFLMFSLVFVTTALPVSAPAQIPVTDVADIVNNTIQWSTNFGQWAISLARALQTYQQLVTTYQYMNHLAQTLQHPDVLSMLPMYGIVDSSSLTNVDSITQFRSMLEGSTSFSAQLGQLYSQIYGPSLNLSSLAPTSPEDWSAATQRINRTVQAADAANLETLAIVSETNKSIVKSQNDGTYSNIASTIKNNNVTPQQTRQAGALAALYTAQNIERLTQITGAQATMQAMDFAQRQQAVKQGLAQAAAEQQAWTSAGDSLKNEQVNVQNWPF